MRKRSSTKPVKSESAPAEPVPELSAPAKNPAAVVLGKLGGAKGGAARAKKLTAEQWSAIAKKGAEARWKKSGRRLEPDRDSDCRPQFLKFIFIPL
jgi:hypothetical protein